MDYAHLPVSAVLRGPLLHTPQGILCVIFCVLEFVTGIAYFLVPAEIAAWPLFRGGPALLIWPVALFGGFCRVSYHDDFKPSILASIVIAVAGALPLAGPYVLQSVA